MFPPPAFSANLQIQSEHQGTFPQTPANYPHRTCIEEEVASLEVYLQGRRQKHYH